MTIDEKVLNELNEKIAILLSLARSKNGEAERLDERLNKLEKKMDWLLEMAPIIDALGSSLIRRPTPTTKAGIHPTTLSKNDNIERFEQVGHKGVFIDVGGASLVRTDRRRK